MPFLHSWGSKSPASVAAAARHRKTCHICPILSKGSARSPLRCGKARPLRAIRCTVSHTWTAPERPCDDASSGRGNRSAPTLSRVPLGSPRRPHWNSCPRCTVSTPPGFPGRGDRRPVVADSGPCCGAWCHRRKVQCTPSRHSTPKEYN